MILLIIPPASFLTNQKVFPNLGILRIGAFIKSKNIPVRILDLSGESDYINKIKLSITNEVKFIGITSVSPQFPVAFEIGKYIKNNYTNIRTIIGGAHVTMAYSSVKRNNNRLKKHIDDILDVFDTMVVGDGEFAIIKVIEGNTDKIIDAEENKDLRLNNTIYETFPFPDRSLIDISSYKYIIDNKNTTSLIGQLGCPFDCNFCGGRNSISYRSIRSRSENSIISEIDYLYKTYGYEGFMFYDDELNVNEHRFNKLLYKLIDYQNKNNLKFSFRGFSRADLLTEQQAELMHNAGFRWLLIGFESGSNKILQNMNKNTTIEQNTLAFKIAKKYNLKIKALMSIGHVGESLETIKETKDWLINVNPDEVDVSIITLYPGSNYFDKSVWNDHKNMWQYISKNGENLYSDNVDFLNDSCFYKSKYNEYISYIETDHLSKIDLINERKKLENLFKRN